MLVALGVAGGGFMYVKNLQANLALSEANNLVLEGGIEEQKKLMAQQLADFEAQKKIYEDTQKKNAQLEKDLKFVKTRFNKTNADGKVRDLGDLANNRPLTVERILNNDFTAEEYEYGSLDNFF